MQGIVKWFNNEKGFGFIEYLPDKDVFVHYSTIKMNGYKTLNEGDLVQYDLMDTNKGLQATNVEILKQVQATK